MKRLLSSIVIISLLIAIVILPIKANPSVAENDLSITKTLNFQGEDSDKTAENRLEKFALSPKMRFLGNICSSKMVDNIWWYRFFSAVFRGFLY